MFHHSLTDDRNVSNDDISHAGVVIIYKSAKPLERRPKVPLASALINTIKATKTRQIGAAITDAIIDAANVAIPRSRPNGWRRKYKPL